jgi:hypothetical protein
MQNHVLDLTRRPRAARTVLVGEVRGSDLIDGIQATLENLRETRGAYLFAGTHDFWEDGYLSQVVELACEGQPSFMIATVTGEPLYIRPEEFYEAVRIVVVSPVRWNEEVASLKAMVDKLAEAISNKFAGKS